MQASVFIDLEGGSLQPQDVSLLKHPNVAGVILFGRNTVDADQVERLVGEIKALRADLLVALDQEGGRVQRLRNGVSRIPAMGRILTQCEGDIKQASEHAETLGWLMCSELAALGIDFSFAPVLDVDYGHNQVIGDRSFAGDIEALNHLADAFRLGVKAAGMISVGKHFPGHGWAQADTHTSSAMDHRTLDEIMAKDVAPFAHAIQGGIEAMMPAHVTYAAVDSMPAGFSTYWLQDVLRCQLGFEGVIFSDDLTMQAAADMGSYAQRAALAINAGCDVLLPCNNRQGVLEVLAYFEQQGVKPCDKVSGLLRTNSVNIQSDTARTLQAQQILAIYNT
ncbi:MAG: beta-N-acetylhexosaminidase [Pontibacterium sp.]